MNKLFAILVLAPISAMAAETSVIFVPQSQGVTVSHTWDSGIGIVGGANTKALTKNKYSYDTWTVDEKTGKPTNLTATSGYKVEWEVFLGPSFKTTENLSMYSALSAVKTDSGCTTAKKDGVIYFQDCRSPVDFGLILGASYTVPKSPFLLDVRYSSTYSEFQVGFGLKF